jgi:hypothetical protein
MMPLQSQPQKTRMPRRYTTTETAQLMGPCRLIATMIPM